MLVQYEPDGKTRIKPEIALVNEGATTAVIYGISGNIWRSSDGQKEKLIWTENLTTVFEPNRTMDTHFESFPGVFLLDKSGAMKQRISLETKDAFAFQPGYYDFEVLIQSEGTANAETKLTYKIAIRPEDIVNLDANKQREGEDRGWNVAFMYGNRADAKYFVGMRSSRPEPIRTARANAHIRLPHLSSKRNVKAVLNCARHRHVVE